MRVMVDRLDRVPIRRRALALTIVALSALTTGCSGGAATPTATVASTQPSASPSAAATPTAVVPSAIAATPTAVVPSAIAATPTAVVPSAIAATPTAQPSPSSVAVLGASGSGAFGPGTYATAFQPPLTFTLVDLTIVGANRTIAYESIGEVDANMPGWIDIAFGFDKPGPHGHGTWSAAVMIIRFDKVFDPKHPGTVVDAPTDFAAWIAKLPGLTVIASPKPVKIGGLDATQFDVQAGDKDVQFGPIPGVNDPPAAGFGPGQRQRLNAVRVQGHDILISIGLQDDDSRDHYDRALVALQPLIDSIGWH